MRVSTPCCLSHVYLGDVIECVSDVVHYALRVTSSLSHALPLSPSLSYYGFLLLLLPMLLMLLCVDLRYASWQCHPSAVLDLQLLSDCAISVSSSRVALTTNGGYTRAAANLTEVRTRAGRRAVAALGNV